MGRRRDRRVAAARAAADDLTPLERAITDAVTARSGGAAMTADRLPIVVACRELIADTVGQLPMIAYRAGVPRPDQPAIVIRPDPFEPRWLTMHRLVNNLTGAGYVWLVPYAFYAGSEQPAAVRVVDAHRATAGFDHTGRMVDVWLDGRRLEPGTGAIWVPWRVNAAGQLGSSPLADCSEAADYLAALYDMAGSFWRAGMPSIAVLVKQTLSPSQAAELKSQVMTSWARRHEPAVIDRDGTLQPIGTNALEAQLVESVGWANAEVARAFGVMPSLVNVPSNDSLTYSTTEGELARWLKLGLGAYLTRIEAAFTDLVPYGTEVRFDTSELLRTDLATRFAAYVPGIAAGIFTADEVRAREGYAPLGAPAAASSPILSDPPASPSPTRSTTP